MLEPATQSIVGEAADESMTTGPPATPVVQGIGVILVEDSPVDVELVTRALEEAELNPRVVVAATEVALEAALAQGGWDLVISDHSLPGFSSTAALEMVKGVAEELPFIVVSGTIGEQEAVRLIRNGAADYVLKDSLARLGSAVTQALAQARARRKARAADEALRESEARYREILETTNEGVWRLDAAGVTDYVNPEMASLLGYDVSEMTGQPLASFMDSIAFESAAAADPGVVEQEFRHKDGSVRLMRVSHKRLSGAAGEHAGSLAMLSDVTQARASEIALEASEKLLAAVTDSMAEGIIALDAKGCFTYLNRAAERMLGWTQAEVSGLTMHDTIHYQREDGTANPVDQSPLTGVRKEGRRVRVDDDVFVRKNDQPLAVSYSSSPILIGNDANQGAVVVFSDATASRAETRRIRNELESLSWVGRIRDALAEDRFVLYAQPIIDLRSGETTSHELLLRMLNREGAVVNPGAFLPSAERFDVIQEIDRWVIGQAARLTARGHSVHFNLSAKSLSDPELIPFITSILAETNADPSLMVCEITETALMKQPDGAEAFTHALTALGCRLALDDFGTGYGGFTYLKRLPISYLKIDIEFVRDLLSNSQNQHVVKAIVALATGFGKQTVAEGVEDELTLTQLTDHGVNGAQGYVIGRPAPAREVFSATAPHQW